MMGVHTKTYMENTSSNIKQDKKHMGMHNSRQISNLFETLYLLHLQRWMFPL